jgi:diguanylate cyclase (GGDEF)-like protein
MWANLCRTVKRESDLVARIGGEQFAVLLPETDPKLAEIIAERLRQMVETTPLLMAEGKSQRPTALGSRNPTRVPAASPR